ncbi:hypothetical protein Q4494_00855 [Celeribacter halophilus]|uniref:Uncharacterized protein n=1 Tax=Celeribacter halophilus TaxID=576117 RepID=A0AAW7XMU8_9RHOB|nr:hypothetical protein [Celeribacter halophilus]MDO6455612.1 hypothetical protein [Celeribacter halophilus]
MQQSLRMINWAGFLGTVLRFVWTIRNIVAIFLLLCTVAYLMFSETLEQRRFMLTKFSEAQQSISVAEGKLKAAGDLAFRVPSKTGASIAPEAIVALETATRDLRTTLVAAPAPTTSIERSRAVYASTLADVLGSINLYEPGGDGERTNDVLFSLVSLEDPAKAYKKAATDYQTSVWKSFWAAF